MSLAADLKKLRALTKARKAGKAKPAARAAKVASPAPKPAKSKGPTKLHPRARVLDLPVKDANKILSPLRPGQKTDDPPDVELMRQRGWVADFIRLGGKEWRWPGKSPLETGCSLRKSVLKEYAQPLAAIRAQLAEPQNFGPESR